MNFPDETATNVLRGAFGILFRRLACAPECEGIQTCREADNCPYARIFEPKQEVLARRGGEKPSGLKDWPRPFVLRALHLNGCTIQPGQDFHFDLVLFEPPERALPYFVQAFRELVRTGLGLGRGRASLERVEDLATASVLSDGQRFVTSAPLAPLQFNFAAASARVNRVVVEFVTPTEMKAQGGVITEAPEFAALFGRLRDRVSTLRACYQGGALAIDFRALGDAARTVQLVNSELRTVAAARRSSRTGQTHSIGGFVGTVEYEGELGVFMPYCEAGRWTGVGRQTVWGKGEIRVKGTTVRVATP